MLKISFTLPRHHYEEKQKMSKYARYYDKSYYLHYDDGRSYANEELWRPQFQAIAQKIVDIYTPKSFLDVGCAYGYLVAALRDLGVEAYGVDVSEFAISQVREDIRPYCFSANVVEGLPVELPSQFDCISTIEVIEHLYEEDAQPFLHAICERTEQVIFSSTGEDISDPVHFNVQQREYWAKRFLAEGFYHDLNREVTFISAQAMAFVRAEKSASHLVEDYERHIRLLTSYEEQERRELNGVISDKEVHIQNITSMLEKSENQQKLLLTELSQSQEQKEKTLAELEAARQSHEIELQQVHRQLEQIQKQLEETEEALQQTQEMKEELEVKFSQVQTQLELVQERRLYRFIEKFRGMRQNFYRCFMSR